MSILNRATYPLQTIGTHILDADNEGVIFSRARTHVASGVSESGPEQLVSAVRCFGQVRQGASRPGPDDRRSWQQIGNTRAESGPIEPTSPHHEKRV
jgi:hypothetical protein